MEPDAGEYIRKVLEPGEELLWAGRPRAGIRINTRGKSFRLTLATLVLIVTILALGRFFNDGRYFDTGVFVAFFLFLFLWIAASPMLMDIHGPTGVDYGLTNQRAIVLHRTSSEESKSFSIRALRSIHFDNHWDGRATLYAAIAAPDWTTANPRFPQPLFYFIDDHERLYSQLTELRPDLGIDPAELWTDPRGYMRTMLEPGEELLWAGQPHVGLHIETSEKYWYLLPAIWIISLLLASPLFVAYWYGWEGALVSFGFLILAIIAGSVLLWKASRLRNDCYGVTDRRVLTVNRRFDGRPFGIPITSLRSIDQIRHADGTTSITCESDSIEWPRDSESLRPTCRPLFRHIDDGEHVYSLLKELQPGVFDEVAGLAARDTRYLNQLLQPNEHLHWFERPPTGLRRQGNDLLQALMALLLIIVPIVCIKAAIDTHDARREGIGEVSGGATTFIVVAGAVLMLKGLHLLFIRYFRDAGFRNSVLYALTNQRAISAKHPNQYGTSVRSVFLDSIADVEIAWEHDGRGAISCRGEAFDWKIPNASQGSFRKLRVNGPLFRSVESPERVSALMASSKAAPPTPLAVYSASSIGAVTERLPGETLRWTGTSDDPGSRDRIAAWFVQFLRWTRNQLELLGALNKVAQRLTSVLRNAPIHRTRNLAYMLTERRVVIIDWTHEERSRRIPLDSLDQLFLQTDRDGKETIFGRSSVRDWPYRYPAGKPVAGPLFPGTDTPETIVAMISASHPAMEQNNQAGAGTAADRQIHNWLLDGETLIWSGRPLPKRPISRFDFWCFLLFVGYAVVAGVLIVQAYQRQPHFSGVIGAIPPVLWGLIATGAAMFLAHGLYRTYLRYLVDPHTWRSTVYGLTDRRAIVQTDRWIQSVPLQRLGHLEVDMQGTRKGSLKCHTCGATWLVFEDLSVRCERAWPFDGYLFRDFLEPDHVRTLMIEAQVTLTGKR